MEDSVELIEAPIELSYIQERADAQFGGELVKAVVDIEKGVMAIGGVMHADEEAFLLEKGSKQYSLWGIDLRPSDKDLVEFDSMINLRPSQGNRSRSVEDSQIREKIRTIVEKLING